jgi:hypothetical protein
MMKIFWINDVKINVIIMNEIKSFVLEQYFYLFIIIAI